MAKHPMDEAALNEVLEAINKAEQVPTEKLIKALAGATGMTEKVIRLQFTAIFQESGAGDDPWAPIGPMIG